MNRRCERQPASYGRLRPNRSWAWTSARPRTHLVVSPDPNHGPPRSRLRRRTVSFALTERRTVTSTTEIQPIGEVDAEQARRLDGFVERAQAAAKAFRAFDHQAVDRIVWAMVVAGLESAVELAELAMEETGFGVFEDKVVKNYIATEFLFDYLKDKRSVGVIDEDPQRHIEYVAEPIGVVLALLPITNPTSTALFKSIVGAKTRNAMVFRPSARAARCAARAVEILQAAGEEAGLPKHALQVIP